MNCTGQRIKNNERKCKPLTYPEHSITRLIPHSFTLNLRKNESSLISKLDGIGPITFIAYFDFVREP